MKPRLLAIAGPLTGTVRPLLDGQLSIGREDTNQLCLLETKVSRKHCTIQQSGEQHDLADLDSRNGTFVNGIPVHRKTLAHGDTIRVGSSEFVFLLHETEPDTSSKNRITNLTQVPALATMRVDHRKTSGKFSAEVGRMARDLAALFRISNIINSIRDLDRLQCELLQLIFEVIPAELGAVILLTDLD
jgi:pSer/pThr/pTyr-binding forkhead associated (FHA) protein